MRVLLVDVPALVAEPLRTRLAGQVEVTTYTGDLLDSQADHASDHDVVIHALGVGTDDRDRLLRSTFGTWNLLHTGPRRRYIQLSSMAVFTGYDQGWDVRESWHPRPTTDPHALACHLGEMTSRDLTRGRDLASLVLRLDEVVGAERFEAGPVDPYWLHVDDAVSAIITALHTEIEDHRHGHWAPLHAVRGDGRYRLGEFAREPYGYRAAHLSPSRITATAPNMPSLTPVTELTRPERITLYGAGGPIGAAALDLLTDRSFVRATDVLALSEIASRPPQSPGAPMPRPLSAPHEDLVVDITDAEQVRAAAVDADCLVNLSVVREQPALAFAVNMLGAWHVAKAAVAEGVQRIVHTGPTIAIASYPWGSKEDGRIDGTQDFRSGGWIYLLTKMLGQEITRIAAEEHQIASPILLYCGFALSPPARRQNRGGYNQANGFTVSWHDSGRSIVSALDVDRLPEPAPIINITAPSPHGQWPADRARDILGWEAEERLDFLWQLPQVPTL